MSRKWLLGVAAALLTIISAAAAGAQTTDPAYGTWKLNVAKSSYSPGPAPKDMTVTIEAAGPGRKVTVVGVDADGAPIKWGYTGSFDRKENPVTGAHPDADVVVLRRLSANTWRSTFKKAGKQTLVNGVSVSSDGKTLTVASTGVNAKSQPVKNTMLFERQ